MNENDETQKLLKSIRRRLRALTVVTLLLVLAVLLCVAAVFGHLVNYFGRDAILWGGATAGAAVLGFVCGWLAGRRA